MRDIKRAIKIEKRKTFKKVDKVLENKKNETHTSNFFSYTLFAFMNISIIAYLFFVTSTFYLAIQERQILLQKNSVAQKELTSVFEENKRFLTSEKSKSERISYINTNAERSISLK